MTTQPTAAPSTQATNPADTERDQADTQTETPEVDWKAKAREWESRAKTNKAAADRLAALEESQKSETQKQADALAAAQREATEARALLLRYEVAKDKGIPEWADLLTGSSREEVEQVAAEVVKRITAVSQPRAPKPDPNQGRQSSTSTSTADLFAAAVEDKFTR